MEYKIVNIDKEEWFALSLEDQLGNTGSEVDRYANLKKANDLDNSQIAFFRAVDLLDLTKQDPKLTRAQRKEICKVKEVFCDTVTNSAKIYDTDLEFFQRYFLDFGILARTNYKKRRQAAKNK